MEVGVVISILLILDLHAQPIFLFLKQATNLSSGVRSCDIEAPAAWLNIEEDSPWIDLPSVK